MIRLAPWAVALALVPLAACNPNPAPRGAIAPQTLPSVSAQDRTFMEQAAGADRFEVSSAHLALDRSTDPRTRGFARQLIDDHSASLGRLAALAQANGIVLPAAMDPDQAQSYATIANSRASFDREFYRQQAIAHQRSIAAYQAELDAGYNDDVKALARQALPMLQQHLRVAQSGSPSTTAGIRPSSPTRP